MPSIDRVVTWCSSSPGVVSVTSTGLAQAISPGEAIVTAASEGVRFSVGSVCAVYFRIRPGGGLYLAPQRGTMELIASDPAKVSIAYKPEGGNQVWPYAEVTAVAPGAVTFTIKYTAPSGYTKLGYPWTVTIVP